MSQQFEFDEVDFITIGTIGPPGQRMFHLQTGQGTTLFTVTIEKEQAAALADGITSILEEIKQKFSLATPEPAAGMDMALREPIQPQFRVGQIGLGYENERDRLVLVLNELQPEDAVESQHVARFRVTRQQMRTLAGHARNVVAGGRPICGNCGRPIDPEGHFCPRSNGHKRETASV